MEQGHDQEARPGSLVEPAEHDGAEGQCDQPAGDGDEVEVRQPRRQPERGDVPDRPRHGQQQSGTRQAVTRAEA